MSQRHDSHPRSMIAPEPRVRRVVIGAAIACLATLWLAATGWLLATW